MKLLNDLLEEIYTLLDQIYGITLNQATILLQPKNSNEESNEAIDLLNEMVEYKEELIINVTKKEQQFEEAYNPYRGKITAEQEVEEIKILVNKIMNKKQEIVEKEKSNVLIMQNLGKKQNQVTHISPTPDKVVNAYKRTAKDA